MRLQNKVAIITGGASGIGWEAAKLFLDEGAKVAIADYNLRQAEIQIATLEQSLNIAAFEVNVANRESVNDMVEQVIRHYGKIDILINNAGITKDGMLSRLSSEDFSAVIEVNLTGVFNCTQAVLPYIAQSESGRIINTSSVSGMHGNVGQTNYSASKAGVIGMTKTWAKELGHKGITVNAVAPGFIETPMIESVPVHLIEQVKLIVPLQRLGKPTEVANAYLFLASDEASYINGTIIEVDGGMMI